MKVKKYLLLASTLVGLGVSSLQAQEVRGQKSLELNGRDQYMRIPSHADFNVSSSESFTVSLWINRKTFNNNARFVAKRSEAPGGDLSGYELWGGQKAIQYYATNIPGHESGGNKYKNSLSAFTNVSAQLNSWVHIAFVVDRTANKMIMYQMGNKAVDSGNKNVALWSCTNLRDVLVGVYEKEPGKYSEHLNGSVDNLRFWKRALTAEEIEQDMRAAQPSPEYLVAAYDFESIKGDQVPDLSGRGHHARLVNFPLADQESVAVEDISQNKEFTGRGNDTEQLVRANLKVKGGVSTRVALHKVTVNLSGTTNLSDVGHVKLVLGKGTNNPLASGARIIGQAESKSGDIEIMVVDTELTFGDNHIWIAADIKGDAKEGNLVDAQIKSIETSLGKQPVANGAPDGARTILLARKLLFAPGDHGSKNYRIPAIITASDGSLVTVVDKRKNNQSDLPEDIDLISRRSTDGGKTWQDHVLIAQGKGRGKGFGDGALTLDKEGNIVCIYVGGNGLFGKRDDHTPIIRTYISKSTDHGQSWSAPKDITDQLYGPGCTDPERRLWSGSFCASGRGHTTRDGRIMFVATIRRSNTTGSGDMDNYIYYSDDNGETWQVSGKAFSHGDEAKVIELNNGDLLMSVRRQGGGARYFTRSSDGGQTWSQHGSWPELIEPNCNGDLVRYTSTHDGYDRDRLLHSIPNARTRTNVSVFVSYDEGATWPVKRSICSSGSAYSSLTILPDGTIGAYTEENPYDANFSMYFLNFSLDWLTSGEDTYKKPVETFPFTLSYDTKLGEVKATRTQDDTSLKSNRPVRKGETVSLSFAPKTGYIVKSILVNAEEKIAEMDQASKLLNLEIAGATRVEVVFADATSTVEITATQRVVLSSGRLLVEGLNSGDVVRIYDWLGNLLGEHLGTATTQAFSIPETIKGCVVKITTPTETTVHKLVHK